MRKTRVPLLGALTLLAAALVQCGASWVPAAFDGDLVLGRPTDRSVTVSVLARRTLDVFAEYGTAPGVYAGKSATATLQAGKPLEIVLEPLQPNTRYYYRLRYRAPGESVFTADTEAPFHAQRPPGATFTFDIQGDSHPERVNRMFDAELYTRTLQNAARGRPDFYVTMGDDFSIDPLISRGVLTAQDVDRVYAEQRPFLAIVGRSAPLFLVNGNHEEAARYLLDGTLTSAPVLAGSARTRFYPLPAPDGFYSGDAERIDGIGLLRDYYAWTWGDALFVVIDFYWHSAVQVDSAPGGNAGRRGEAGTGGRSQNPAGNRQPRAGRQGGGGRTRDWWGITLGDAQYRWLQQTLEQSKARFKFVFAHHVLGTGRGAIELAGLYEWGGKDQQGVPQFAEHRPKWASPIHELMMKTGVTAFFQGHDHLFARQQLDGIVYQEVPNPADPTYQAFNREAYRSGDILPNSGYLRVTVAPDQVKVDYVRTWLPKDENGNRRNGEVAFSYVMKRRAVR